MNRRWSSSSSDGLEEANIKVLAMRTSTPEELTMRRCIASDELCMVMCGGGQRLVAPNEPTPGKA
jgi:hypothetical protein